MKRILILSFTDPDKDVRVLRQISALRPEYELYVAGMTSKDGYVDGITWLPLAFRRSQKQRLVYAALRMLRLKTLAWRYYEGFYSGFDTVNHHDYDLVLVNDLEPLPFGLRAAKGAPVIFDAHEYYPEKDKKTIVTGVFPRLDRYLLRKYAGKASAVMAVCDGAARLYRKNFGLSCSVVTNAAPYQDLPVRPVAEDGRVRLVHHGGSNSSRRLDTMIEMMKYVDPRFSLDLILVPNPESEIKRLKALSAGMSNVRFLDPVPVSKVSSMLNASYDIGVYILEPATPNLALALPNKLFEFIQGRLMVAIGPSPEMARLVTQERLGIVAKDFSPKEMALALNGLSTEDIQRYKENAHGVAKKYCSENEEKKIVEIVSSVLR